MQLLDMLTLPLQGVRLIEASAGTGKTYTIANLYLRLLLERRLTVQQILVVTFTNAATEELRDRIRKRIRQGIQGLQGQHAEDADLQHILQRLADPSGALQDLKDALVCLDEAAVFTIHGFCQRMLNENAFESGTLFDAELVTDESEFLRQIAEDFWRQEFYQLDQPDAQWVKRRWKGPLALLGSVRAYLQRHDLTVIPQVDAPLLQAVKEQRAAQFVQLQQLWLSEGETIRQLLEEAKQHKVLNARSYTKSVLAKLFAALDGLSEQAMPEQLPDVLKYLTSDKLALATLQGETPQHEMVALCDALLANWQRPDDYRAFFIQQQLMAFIHQQLAERKQQRNVLSTDDLLLTLQQALADPQKGPTLARHIARQYPVALIDEFQDTDPVQYQIFSTIYPPQGEGTLFMIGDPKQAIYSFRGADIFTYMQARHHTRAHYTLPTNWRSSNPLVRAVNELFAHSPQPFIYGEDIPFHPVEAAGQADQTPLQIDGAAVPPLQVWKLARNDENIAARSKKSNPTISKERAGETLSQHSAQEIARLLNLGVEGRALIGEQPLQPRDIAVLVRSHKEAEQLQGALRAYGIASAYISRDSVFDSPEAQAMGRLLQAVMEPADEGALRAALCDQLIAMTAPQLLQTVEDDNAWEAMLEQFQRYHHSWRDHGFMAMFQRLLHEQQLPQTLLNQPGGERALSNLLQLAELLQTASKQQHGMEALFHWYRRELAEHADDEARQLRLESDESLVQIITIHKSKGLEYSVVFLPFIYSSFPLRSNQPLLFHRAEDQQLVLDMGSEDYAQHHRLADRERLAEELRLLYVALTRAKYLCYLPWGQVNGAAQSALGYLLHGGGMADLDDPAIFEPWQTLAQQDPNAFAVQDLPQADATHYRGAQFTPQPLSARVFTGRIDRSWQISSFTALTQHRGGLVNLPDHDQLQPVEPSGPISRAKDIYRFPKGANAGQMMHAIFELIDFTRNQADELPGVVAEQLQKYGFAPEWQGVIETMVDNVLHTPLDQQVGLKLAQLIPAQKLVELEFNYPLAPLSADRLNAVLQGLADYHPESPSLAFAPHQGMMTGFIDLIFEHQGRFYILDYKSNHLGDQPDCYGPDQLTRAMAEHRYDLQYLIYTVALHRYLQRRLPGYCYGQHFGGVYYLFLRGMAPARGNQTGIYFDKPDEGLIEALDALFRGGEAAC